MVTFRELRATIKADYDRLLPIKNGGVQRFLFSPTYNLVFWFRLLSYLQCKKGAWKILYVILLYKYKWKCARLGIDLRIGTKIGRGLCIAHCGSVVINISSTIGDNCLIFQDVTIGGMMKQGRMLVPHIGDNVILFAGAKIIGDVKVGNNVVIGANSVVTHDVCDNAVIAGIPGKIISMNGIEYSEIYKKGRI